MDAPPGFRQPAGQKKRGLGAQRVGRDQGPQLFEDTSTQQGFNYGQNPGYSNFVQDPYTQDMQFPGQQFINDPMASMAMQYGTSLAGQGKEYMNKNIEKYVVTSKLKYYFAVDTTYVGKKLGLIFFPYTHTDWSIRYSQDEPVAPRYEINAPDLYIPVMAFVTYILVAGVMLGIQNRFTPEQLGIQASSALVWVIIELLVVLLSLYIMNVNTDLKYMDILSFCGYKFVGIISSLLGGLLFKSMGYYIILLWFSLSTVFFLIRILRVQILPHTESDGYTRGSKRSLYLILSISLVQPLLMWWLTAHIMFIKK